MFNPTSARPISPTTVSPLPGGTQESGKAPASKSERTNTSSSGHQVAALASLPFSRGGAAGTSNPAFQPSSNKLARRNSMGSYSSDAARLEEFRAKHQFKGKKTDAPNVGGSAEAPLTPVQINNGGQSNPPANKLARRNSMASISAYSSDTARLDEFKLGLTSGEIKSYGVEKSAEVTFTPEQMDKAQQMVGEAIAQALTQLTSEGKMNENTRINFAGGYLEEKIEPKLLEIVQSPISDDEKKEALQGLVYEAIKENIKHDAAPVVSEADPHKPSQTADPHKPGQTAASHKPGQTADPHKPGQTPQYAPPSSPPPLDPKMQAAMEASMQQMMQQYPQFMQQMMQLQAMYMNFVSSLLQTMAQTLEKGNHAMIGR